MRLLVVLILTVSVATTIHGAPAKMSQVKANGPLSEALLTSSTSQPGSSGGGPLENKNNNENTAIEDSRRPKMINYFGYYPGYFGAAPVNPQAAAAYGGGPTAAAASYSPYDFYQFPYGTIAPVYSYNGLLGTGVGGGGVGGDNDDGYENDEQSGANDVDTGDDYEDMFSRANRRRPGKGNAGGSRNSPIFYIRLPPTPYMFIQGMGYISNPPTITPLPAPVPQFSYPNPYQNPYRNPYMPAPSAPYMPQSNPFINVPLNFMSNAKPVGVYQYQSPQTMHYPNQVPLRQRPYATSNVAGGGAGNGYSNPDSKITHLKGPFIFNGRPEDIYLLQNLQTTPYNANFFHGYY